MINNCFFCQAKTTNPKFCSRSCAAKQNNLIPKRKRKIRFCYTCNTPLDKKRKFCDSCFPRVDWSTKTYSEVTGIRKYQKNSRIRELARSVFAKSNKPKYCIVCKYDKHIEVCHIKPISSFPPNTPISTINDIENLVGLCPNHHWELDNQLFTLDSPFLATYTSIVSNTRPIT